MDEWQASNTTTCSAPSCDCAAVQHRLRGAEAEIRRLTRCLQLKDQKLCELRKVLAHSATVHYCVEDRLQRELDALRINMPADGMDTPFDRTDRGPSIDGVVVKLPYMTAILSVLFDTMVTFWADCDRHRLPKSSTVARAIDERLGLSGQSNGDASRSSQAYASAIRPDWVKDADMRHHRNTSVRRYP
ncbi:MULTISPECIES: hypothetical protein [Burkholderia]|uniref:Uncharacterized protein n=1 Tax=Burkholderia pyrrocinia TaxID=60550 RepID=A0A318I185_BURPY|nr:MULTISPECIES: hypothetical protein [Burkholderia]PXX23116.1 hypothetical protein NA66_103644 [Burkholderia pyrrocinia]SFW88844.1 hypothetical protein SAMN03159384_06704 [Burkholderia sp. NFACC33-1]SFY46196.1 hypothetical protein SAMN03159408_06731 [Burkholderia sp. NFPP32]